MAVIKFEFRGMETMCTTNHDPFRRNGIKWFQNQIIEKGNLF